MTVSAAVFPKRKQNLMQTRCSFKSAIEKSTKTMTEAQEKKITQTLQTFPQGRRLANRCGGQSRTRTKREQTDVPPLSPPEKILVIFGSPLVYAPKIL